jgi:hypothetical protein
VAARGIHCESDEREAVFHRFGGGLVEQAFEPLSDIRQARLEIWHLAGGHAGREMPFRRESELEFGMGAVEPAEFAVEGCDRFKAGAECQLYPSERDGCGRTDLIVGSRLNSGGEERNCSGRLVGECLRSPGLEEDRDAILGGRRLAHRTA